jgi:Flp pilus assembly protein TadD
MPKRSGQRVPAAAAARSSGFIRSKVRRLGVIVVCANVAAVPLVFDHDADNPFTAPKALLSHGIAYVLVAIIGALGIRYGRQLFVWSWLHVVVLAFLAVNVLATIFGVDPLLALYGTHERMLGLSTVAAGVVLYFAVVFLIRTRLDATAVIACAVGASALVLAYEAVQLAGKDPLTWNVDATLRPLSTFGQTNSLALYLAVITVLCGAAAAFPPGIPRSARALLLACGLGAAVGIVPTLTRSALIGVAAAAGVLVILTFLAYPDPRARRLSLAVAAVTTAAFALVLLLTPLGARLLNTVEFSATAEGDSGPHLEQSAEVRLALYSIAFDILRERPVLGYGPDSFVVGVPRYRSANEPFEVQESTATSAHGWPAQIAATTGVAGLLTFVGILMVAVWTTVRAGFRPVAWIALGALAAYLAAGVTTVNWVGTEWLFWVPLGAVAAATGMSQTAVPTEAGRRVDRSRDTPGRRLGAGVLLAVGLVLVVTMFSALSASRSIRASQVTRLQGHPSEAIDLGLRATQADPQRAQYWDTLGLAYVAAGRFKDAASSFDDASRLAPYDARYDGDLARAYLALFQRGDAASGPRARMVADRVVQRDPNNPKANLTRAIVMQVTGDLPEALRSIERAFTLSQSNDRDIFLTATQVLLGLGRSGDAIAMAHRGIDRLPNPADQVPVRIELVRALIASGQTADALAELDAILAIQPGQPTALQLQAQIQSGVGR